MCIKEGSALVDKLKVAVEFGCVIVCLCVRERECVCVCKREGGRDLGLTESGVGLVEHLHRPEGVCVCLCLFVCVVCVCVCVCVCVDPKYFSEYIKEGSALVEKLKVTPSSPSINQCTLNTVNRVSSKYFASRSSFVSSPL